MGEGIPQKVSLHNLFTANVYDGGCKRLRWRLQTFAGKDANVCGEKRLCTARTDAVHCGSGCSALRLRWVKLAPKSSVLFWIRDKGGETHPIRVSVAPQIYLVNLVLFAASGCKKKVKGQPPCGNCPYTCEPI